MAGSTAMQRERSIPAETILAWEDSAMERTDPSAPAHPYVRSDRVEGTAVYAADGSRIGTIKYLEIDKLSGQVISAITSFRGFLAVQAETHTIPWGKLKYDQELHGYRTDITQEQLHDAPEFSRGQSSIGSRKRRNGCIATGMPRPESEPFAVEGSSGRRRTG